jgi:hypothetical protein
LGEQAMAINMMLPKKICNLYFINPYFLQNKHIAASATSCFVKIIGIVLVEKTEICAELNSKLFKRHIDQSHLKQPIYYF